MASNDDSKDFQQRVQDALASGMPIPDFPEVSPLRALAMAQAEVCGEYEEAGFDRGEALYMTAVMFTNNPGDGPAKGGSSQG